MLFNTLNKSSGTTILIRLSTKCSSNCLYCELPYLKSNKYNNLLNLSNILKFCELYFDKNFIFGILGFDLLNNDKYIFFYYIIKKYPTFKYSIQLGFNDLFLKTDKILNLSKQNINIEFGIQKIINKKSEIIDIIKSINIINSKNIKINISYIIDFKKFGNLIKLLISKYKYGKNENGITFYIGTSIIEFENNIGINDIDKFGFNKCVSLENFYIKDNEIVIKNDIEITLDGDIKFHLNNFCNQGIKKISNIYKKPDEILNNFNNLNDILIVKDKETDKCKKCLKKPVNIL